MEVHHTFKLPSKLKLMTLAPLVTKYLVVLLSVAVATLLRFTLGLLWPDLPIFGLYYIATLFVTVTWGVHAGLTAAALGTVADWWFFVRPPFAFLPVPDDMAANITLSLLISVAIVAIAARERPSCRHEAVSSARTPAAFLHHGRSASLSRRSVSRTRSCSA